RPRVRRERQPARGTARLSRVDRGSATDRGPKREASLATPLRGDHELSRRPFFRKRDGNRRRPPLPRWRRKRFSRELNPLAAPLAARSRAITAIAPAKVSIPCGRLRLGLRRHHLARRKCRGVRAVRTLLWGPRSAYPSPRTCDAQTEGGHGIWIG